MELKFVSKIGDVVTLDNKDSYMVMDCIVYNDRYYVSAGLVDTHNQDANFEVKYFEEIITDEKKLVYREVTDEETKKSLFELQQEFKEN